MKDYLFDKNAGWIPGIVTPSGFAILFLLLIMGLFSHRLVRKSGRFEVTLIVFSFPRYDAFRGSLDDGTPYFPTGWNPS